MIGGREQVSGHVNNVTTSFFIKHCYFINSVVCCKPGNHYQVILSAHLLVEAMAYFQVCEKA